MFKNSFFSFMSHSDQNKNKEDNKIKNSEKPILSSNSIHQISSTESTRKSLDSLIHAQRVSKLGNWDYDIVTDRAYWSDQMYRIFGLEKMAGFFMSFEKFLDFVHPHDRENYSSHVRKTIEHGIPYDVEFRIIRLDGTESFVRGQGEALFDSHKKPVRMIGTIQDITQQIQMWKAVKESEQQYKALFHQNPDGVVLFDLQGNFIDINSSFMKMIGYTSEEFPARFMPLVSNEHIMETCEFFRRAAEGEPQHYYTVVIHKNGHPIDLSVTNVPTVIDEQIMGVYAIIKDITKRRRIELALREAEGKYRSLVEESSIGVFIIQDDICVYSNSSLNKMWGYDTLEGRSLLEIIVPEDRSFVKSKLSALTFENPSTHYECRIVKSDNSIVILEIHTNLTIYNGKPARTGMMVDITEKKQAEDLNKYLAYHDPLTALPNRRLFENTLEEKIAEFSDGNQNFAVMYLDINRFNYLNETMGPTFGDYLLTKIAERLKDSMEENGFIARVGGDKFALLLHNSQKVETTVEFAQRITGSMEKPFWVGDYELYVTASIGISIYPVDGTDTETLQKNAEIALHQAKEYGKSKCQVYTPSMNIESFKMFRLENDLRKALEREELFLEYQPRCDGKTGKILGVEAVV
ncbi:sensor domain-containing protein [Aneurinibacillus tyrosinisolvens]|uniref:sensor domain-containing protein n=1 Tax=Aneurinibacillus tyrosinisolvens TaxID=1443435 RepID=UPI00063F04FE|nr:PAS domain S-box protein [Aneurinibacillus tyrosinisolvens]